MPASRFAHYAAASTEAPALRSAGVQAPPRVARTPTRFEITEPGEHQVIFAVDGHFEAGIQGTLIVS